ncbi:MAG: NAD(P)/FAD-dependent oxidoreductase [Pseudomonadota bacterium]
MTTSLQNQLDPDFVFDVVVVGAGAAGIGVAVALRHAGIEKFIVLERDRVGSSFANWPAETRFITPSFPTNSVGMLDLNSVAIGVSPAFSMEVEHPTGPHYAEHLGAVADHFDLPIYEQTEVNSVTRQNATFDLDTSEGTLRSKHLIWAAGEFQFPRKNGFAGAEHCRHTATVASYDDIEGDDVIVIGGFESGIDAAYHLAYRGKRVRVFDSRCPWESTSSDPSITLSPFTLERFREPVFSEQVSLFPNTPVTSVEQVSDGYHVIDGNGATHRTSASPLWAGGFDGGHSQIGNLFVSRPDGLPELSENDESTRTPGLFLCGPSVRHDNHVFCFIYKYRQRFAVVAKAIANSLDVPAEGLKEYRVWGMYLDDLSCCGGECVC